MTQIQRLLSFVRPYLFWFIAAIVLMAVVGMCEGLVALLIRPSIDTVLNPANQTGPILLFKWPVSGNPVYLQDFIPHRIHNVWAVVAFAIVAVITIKGISEFLATYSINFVGHSVVRDLRNLLYAKVIEQSVSFFSKNPTGKLMSAITSDIEKIQNAVSQTSADFLKESFTLLGLLFVVFYMDWKLALGSMLLVPFVVFPAANIGRYIRKSSRSSQDRMAELNSVLQETFSGIRIVKAFGMEIFEVMKFKAATRRLLRINLRWVIAQALTSPLMEILGAVTVAGLLLYARNQILHREQTMGGFVVFLYALIKMYEPIKRLTGINNNFQQAIGASEQVFHYLDLPPQVADKPGAITLKPFHDSVVFEDVDFDYEDGVPLLRNVELRIGKGEVVAIVGSSGAGKTTLANLIPRFFDVTRGRVLFDGHDIRDVKLSSLRAQIGMVTQETILFNDTVFNNICYGAKPKN
jgi:subfamily B ATP-binding cassette protein MsbA